VSRPRPTGTTLSAETGARLRSAREEAGVSQTELGERSGVSQTTVGKLERGAIEFTVGYLVVLAEALALDPCGLLPAARKKKGR
jgi:transcriptional regulator with XRE-family HTH domain